MKGMVREKGIVPERSEWFRSSRLISTTTLCDGAVPSRVYTGVKSCRPSHNAFPPITPPATQGSHHPVSTATVGLSVYQGRSAQERHVSVLRRLAHSDWW